MSVPIIDAEVVLECNNALGEGALWDADAKLVRWIDIDEATVHAYDPVSKKYCVDSYEETDKISNIALTKDPKQLIAQTHHDIALLPASTPTEVSHQPKPIPRKLTKILASPMTKPYNEHKEARFNDGGVDPQGRFYAGSMALGDLKKQGDIGELLRYDPDGTLTQILKAGEVGTSNGLGWSPDGTKMYFVDSGKPEISVWDYDGSTGTPSNRQQLVGLPPAMDDLGTKGVFDGLSVDGVGNIWVARWRERRIIGYTPEGKVIAFIRCPGSLCTTIPCFAGPNLDVMYIATARATQAGEKVEDYPASGHLFKVDFGPGSEVRKLLGEGWKGKDKHVFAL